MIQTSHKFGLCEWISSRGNIMHQRKPLKSEEKKDLGKNTQLEETLKQWVTTGCANIF